MNDHSASVKSVEALALTRNMSILGVGKIVNIGRGSVNTHLTVLDPTKMMKPRKVMYRHTDRVWVWA